MCNAISAAIKFWNCPRKKALKCYNHSTLSPSEVIYLEKYFHVPAKVVAQFRRDVTGRSYFKILIHTFDFEGLIQHKIGCCLR